MHSRLFQTFKTSFNFAKNNKNKKIILGLTLAAFGSNYVFMSGEKKKEQKVGFYAWGNNNFGQLGLGHEIGKFLPQKVELFADENIDLSFIDTKGSVSSALTADGKLYTWGQSKGGILGHENQTTANVTLPTLLESLIGENIKYVAVGSKHIAAINDKGEVFTWGNSDHGKLGRTNIKKAETSKYYNTRSYLEKSVYSKPEKLESLQHKKVVQIACGNYHTICLTSDNEVYSWGSSKRGVLGYKAEEDVIVPRKIDFFDGKKVLKIESGANFNIALTDDGKLYSWGSNDYGQLGKSTTSYQENPFEIPGLSGIQIKDFSCGDQFVGSITKDGKLYTWGFGSDGQLGHKNRSDVKSPKLVEFSQKISLVSCGGAHTAVITDKGELFMFGRGKEGQLGQEESIQSSAGYRTEPKLVETFKNKKVLLVKCGGEHTIALVEEK